MLVHVYHIKRGKIDDFDKVIMRYHLLPMSIYNGTNHAVEYKHSTYFFTDRAIKILLTFNLIEHTYDVDS